MCVWRREFEGVCVHGMSLLYQTSPYFYTNCKYMYGNNT